MFFIFTKKLDKKKQTVLICFRNENFLLASYSISFAEKYPLISVFIFLHKNSFPFYFILERALLFYFGTSTFILFGTSTFILFWNEHFYFIWNEHFYFILERTLLFFLERALFSALYPGFANPSLLFNVLSLLSVDKFFSSLFHVLAHLS